MILDQADHRADREHVRKMQLARFRDIQNVLMAGLPACQQVAKQSADPGPSSVNCCIGRGGLP